MAGRPFGNFFPGSVLFLSPMPDLRRRVLLCIIAAIAVLITAQAWNRLQGQLNHLRLKDLKADWHEATRVPHDEELNEGFKLGYKALEHDPGSAEYRFMLASMHAWREKSLRLWPDQAAAETEKVVENLKAALARRPTWFEAWILLALVKFQANEIDQQFKAAVEKAIETGPYETSVHHGLSFIGPRVLDRLDPELQGQVLAVMRTALDNTNVNRFVVEQIVMNGMEDVFNDRLTTDENLAKLVERFRKKRSNAL